MSTIGAGYDVIDVGACNNAGIIVCNQSGTNKETVAEHTLAFMLALAKKITVANRIMLREDGTDRLMFVGNDLQSKTLGVVGIGNIGTRTGQFGRMLDMQVLAYDPYLTEAQIARRGGAKVELAELLERSDFICVHRPRSRETMGMFGAAEFAKMKLTAYFINTARGGIHNESDLAQALRQGRIAGAGIDVFDVEPPPRNHPLLQLDNVVATPHTAGFTSEAWYNVSLAAAEQWIALLRGRVPPRLVNPEAWPLHSQRFEALFGFRPDALDTV
jgi:D-3-phosphoglycerate dehydrogenase